MKFYSKEELASIKSTIKSGEKLTVAAKRLSKELNRSENSVYVKLLAISGRMGKRTKRVRKQQPTAGGVSLKSGFVFDFKPQRAEMHQDHVRLYF